MSEYYDSFKNDQVSLNDFDKKYFIIDQQIARHFLQYNECLSNPPSLLSNSNN